MQTNRTIQFWDKFHEDNKSKEWISSLSTELMDILLSRLCNGIRMKREEGLQKDCQFRMLEIGCGTSTMARELLQSLMRRIEKESKTQIHVHMCATDVSQVCIDVNNARDDPMTLRRQSTSTTNQDDEESLPSSSYLEYRVLNVLEEKGTEDSDFSYVKSKLWDVILDKGCVDTFLFRSKNRGETLACNTILEKVLKNVWSWMAPHGIFMAVSPRSKIKAIRDFSGFSRVEKIPLPKNSKGDLVGQKTNTSKVPAYVYVCHKNQHYEIDGDMPTFKANFRDVPKDNAECPNCQMTFGELRNGEAVEGRGKIFWTRQWKGHCIHCKSPHQSKW